MAHPVHVLCAATTAARFGVADEGMAAIGGDDKPARLQKATPAASAENRNERTMRHSELIGRLCFAGIPGWTIGVNPLNGSGPRHQFTANMGSAASRARAGASELGSLMLVGTAGLECAAVAAKSIVTAVRSRYWTGIVGAPCPLVRRSAAVCRQSGLEPGGR